MTTKGASPTNVYLPEVATFIAIAVFVLITVALGLLFFVKLPIENAQTVSLIVGQLLGYAGLVIGYYYGTSKTSAAKDETNRALAAAVESGTSGSTTVVTHTPNPLPAAPGASPSPIPSVTVAAPVTVNVTDPTATTEEGK